MTPRHVDADAWRLVVIIGVGGWLAVDLSPLAWPYYVWLIGLGLAVGVYVALGGDGDDVDAPAGDDFE